MRLKVLLFDHGVRDFVLYRMLLVMPFPAFISKHHKCLGTIFDASRILPRFASRPANCIVRWSTKWVHVMAAVRARHAPATYFKGK